MTPRSPQPAITDQLGLGRLAGDMALTVVRQGASAAFIIISTVIVGRTLGPTGEGAYVLALLLPSVVMNVVSAGIGPATAYYVGRGDISVRDAVWGNLALVAMIAPFGYAVIGAALVVRRLLPSDPFAGISDGTMLLGSVVLLAFLIETAFLAILQGRQRFRAYNLVAVAPNVVKVVLMFVVLVILRLDVVAAVAVAVVGQLCGVAAAFAAVLPLMEPTDADTPHRRVSAAYAGRLASYGLRAHPATIVTFAMYRLDALVIGALMMATGPVGLYSVAYQWAHRLGFLSQALGTVLMPRIAQLADAEEVRRALTPIVTRTAVWLSIPGALVMAVAAPVVIPGLYGERFADSVLPLQVMLPGVALWNVSRTLSSDLAGRGRPGASSAVDVGGLLLNVALDVAWIPEHGIVGAAAATTASLAIATVAKVALYATVAGVPWRQLFVPEAADGERLRTAVERLLRPLRRGRSAR